MAERVTVLVAARDEGERIQATVERLRAALPASEVIVADDGSRDRTPELAEAAGARVLRFPARGKGQALTLAERDAPPGRLLLCDADLRGDPTPLLAGEGDLTVAVFAERRGGGFGIAKGAARALIAAATGMSVREPLSGQRAFSTRARAACFPLAAGFGCEVRSTIDAARAGLRVVELELPLAHRATGRDARGFLHRGRQLADALLACGPLAVNRRGLRLPLVGVAVALGGLRAPRATAAGVAAVALIGLADDLWSGPERGVRAHLRAARTTGVFKLVAIPATALAVTRSPASALVVSLAGHALNLLDTAPGRALKAFLGTSALVRGTTLPYAAVAVLLLPYDLREMSMLGDAGSNALGAVLGFGSVSKLTGGGRAVAIAALAGLALLGEVRSLGRMIERAPLLSAIDRLGRQPA